MKKKLVSLILALFFLVSSCALPSQALEQIPDFDVEAKSAILMEASSGTALYEKNADEALSPASVTKIMTLLLVMEEIEAGRLSLSDTVTASAYATSMGGSQIYLKEGEQMSVEDMLKSVVIASANDAAVALAEHICGSEESFVRRMNERARELGMMNTNFENTNGLDDTATNHVTSARDIAIMSRELIKHKKILEYSSTWMDTVRDGAFGLTNTNRLVRFYKGANGLKTGSTSKAGFCISATADRDGMTLIAVIMGSPTRDVRNREATRLLDMGFSGYSLYTSDEEDLGTIPVKKGELRECRIIKPSFSCLVDNSKKGSVQSEIKLLDSLSAPVREGDVAGRVIYRCGDEIVGEADIICAQSVKKLAFWSFIGEIFAKCLLLK